MENNIGKNFEYRNIQLSDIQVELININEAREAGMKIGDQGSNYLFHGGTVVKCVVVDGERIAPTSRFWDSLYARFNLNKAFFRFFDHAEVFKRISERESDAKVRVCIERDKTTGDSRLLAATGLNKPVLLYDDLFDLLGQFQLEGGVKYTNGVVESTHTPRMGSTSFAIGGDKFQNKFTMHAPIDGYGQPSFYLSLLRLICSNGMVGFANTFRTALQLGSGGDNIMFTLRRALEGFSNEDGYAQMRDRYETAMSSWASLREQGDLYRLLLNVQGDKKLDTDARQNMMSSFEDMTGRPEQLYHRDPHLFSPKKLRTLPVECKVYDMINFATEVATHKVGTDNARKLQAWVGGMLSGEYDLEGSCDHFSDWRDFFLADNRKAFEDSREKGSQPVEVVAEEDISDDEE